jgi:hypothetical protein
MKRLMEIIVFVSMALAISSCASRSEVDRVLDQLVYVGPPAAYLECPPPFALTDEEIDGITDEAELAAAWLAPEGTEHETCYVNSLKVKKWMKERNLAD